MVRGRMCWTTSVCTKKGKGFFDMNEEKRSTDFGHGVSGEWPAKWTLESGAPYAPTESTEATNDHPNRRRFLKSLLIGSAVATTGGALTVVALEQVAASPLSTFKFLGAANSPGSSTASACTTGTNPSNYVEQSTFNHSESIYLWGLFTNLPAGKYTLSVDPTIQAQGHAVCTPSPAPNPLEYNGGSSSSSNARLYDMSASSVSWDCSPPKQSSLPNATRQGGSLESIISVSTPISVATGDDLQLQIHMKNGCSGGRTIVVTITLFQVANNTPVQFLQAHTTITITA
jgi:hypothetical protein